MSSPLVLRVLAGMGWCGLAPTVDTSVVRSAESSGVAVGLLRVPSAGRHPGTQPRVMLGSLCVPGAGDQLQPKGQASLLSCSSPLAG